MDSGIPFPLRQSLGTEAQASYLYCSPQHLRSYLLALREACGVRWPGLILGHSSLTPCMREPEAHSPVTKGQLFSCQAPWASVPEDSAYTHHRSSGVRFEAPQLQLRV